MSVDLAQETLHLEEHDEDIPWEEVLGAAVVTPPPSKKDIKKSREPKRRVYLLVERAPPALPWLIVDEDKLGMEPERFVDQIEQRLQRSGYRDVLGLAPPIPKDELFRKILAHEPLAGAVEIAIQYTQPSNNIVPVTVVGGVGGAWFGLQLIPVLGAWGILGGAVAGVASIAVATQLPRVTPAWKKHGTKPKRVLVLAPDGFILGLPDGPKAFAWSEVSEFRHGRSWTELSRTEPRPSLQVMRDDQPIAVVDALYFAEDLEVIVAVAEAYRKRRARGR